MSGVPLQVIFGRTLQFFLTADCYRPGIFGQNWAIGDVAQDFETIGVKSSNNVTEEACTKRGCGTVGRLVADYATSCQGTVFEVLKYVF
jgi:hypothetical protein